MNNANSSECFIGNDGPLIIAGPCSAETEDQVIETAKQLSKISSVKIFRAGIWKPRTRPNSFEGVGEQGLPWLKRVKEETGLLTTTEVANTKHVELALKHGIDILWIGARTTVSPFTIQEMADALRGVDIPVMIKNPINADIELWVGAIERIQAAGIKHLAAIHRGFSTFEKIKFRNSPKWKIPVELKQRIMDIPMICDPSHIAGKRELILEVSQKAMNLNMNGLMIESHIDPDKALSDASQQVTPAQLSDLLQTLSYKTEFSTNESFENELERLRKKIDNTDEEIIKNLHIRMEITKEIGMAKLKNNITMFQPHRMDELMKERIEQGETYGLTSGYVKAVYTTIHNESVREQMKLAED